MSEKHIGKVIQVIGPVLDIQFKDGELPDLLNAIEIDNHGQKLVVEVAQLTGDNVARWLMDDLVLGRPLPEGFTIARGESLYTVAPKAILLDYIRDDALRREVRGLYALGRDADPLDYPAEKSLRRRLYPLVFAFRQWKTCRAAMADKRAREKAVEDLEGAGAIVDRRTKGTVSGKDDECVACVSPELPLADRLAARAKAAS